MKTFFRKLKLSLMKPAMRHGTRAVLITFLLLCALVLVNIAVTSLEDTHNWQFDLSFNRYATLGEETEAVLGSLTQEVELYLLYQSGEEDAYLDRLLNRYASLSEKILYLPTDITKNPGILSRFESSPDDTPAADSVIAYSPATGRYRILDYSDFLSEEYNSETGSFEVDGYAYEKQLTQAIVYVVSEKESVIGLLQGHGEYSTEELETFVTVLENHRYTLREINLQQGDTLDETVCLLILACPQKDLSESEVSEISAWAKEGGNLMVWRDYSDSTDLPQYFSLLRAYGVIPLSGIAVASTQDSGSYYQEQVAILPYMENLDLTASLVSSGMDVLLLPGSSAFETPAEGDASLSVATVLKSGAHAWVRDFSDGIDSIEQQPQDKTGEISLALYAHRMYPNGNVSRMFAIGCGAMFTQEYIYQRTFLEEMIVTVLQELAPEASVSLDIPVSEAVRPALTVGSETMATVLVVALPVLILFWGVFALLRRGRR